MTTDPKKMTSEQGKRLVAKIREMMAESSAIEIRDIRHADDEADNYIEFGLLVARSALDKSGIPDGDGDRILEEERAELTVLRDVLVAWWKEKVGGEKSVTKAEFAEFLRAFRSDR